MSVTTRKYSCIGKRIPKIDARDKVMGRAVYIQDLEFPGLLHGKILRSVHSHAKILQINTEKAKKLPGVAAVITAKDIPRVTFGAAGDNTALKGDKVRSFRDEVAAVAALDLETAQEALDLIEVEYEPLPSVFDPYEALQEGAPLIHQDRAGNLVPLSFNFESGHVEEGFKISKILREDTFKLPFVTHCPMGTCGMIAQFDSGGNLTIWSTTQIPFLLQKDLGRVLKMPANKIRILQTAIGGAFGSKLDMYPYEPICAFLAKAAEKPVKILFTREEEFLASPTRQPAVITIKTGVTKDRKIQAREVKLLLDNGAYTSWGATTPYVMMMPVTTLYKPKDIRFSTQTVYTNNPYSGAFRGYGNPQMTFALESQMDMLAEDLGMDPLELRLLNANEKGEESPQDFQITTCGFKECLEKAAQGVDWKKNRNPEEKRSILYPSGRKVSRGVGLASMFHVGGGARVYRSDGCGCFIKMDDFGGLVIIIGATEIGQGSDTTIAQIAAETLGVSIEQVTIVNNDTQITPWDVGVHASRTTFIAGNATHLAALDLRNKLLDLAAGLLKVPRDMLDIEEGVVFSQSDPDLKIPLDKVIRSAHFTTEGSLMLGYGYYDPPTVMADKTHRGNIAAAYSFGVQAVEVEVDEETGKVCLLNSATAVDIGKVINPLGLEGQVEGGAVMGFGYALSEEMMVKDGKVLNPNFHDYKLFTMADIPPIQTFPVETEDPEGPYGAKGVGEAGAIMAAAAVANAIYHATGVRMTELPITPEKLFFKLRSRVLPKTRAERR